jgi:hypothetical protein
MPSLGHECAVGQVRYDARNQMTDESKTDVGKQYATKHLHNLEARSIHCENNEKKF